MIITLCYRHTLNLVLKDVKLSINSTKLCRCNDSRVDYNRIKL